jgi:hypothetical protein
MPTVDNLDVKISAEATDAEKSLDSLASKLKIVSEQLTKAFGTDGLKNVSSATKQASASMSGVSAQAKSASQSISNAMNKANVPIEEVKKNAQEIAEKYKDLGKNFTFSGSIESAQKLIEKYSNSLETAKLKKEELEMSGKTEGQMYEYAIRDIQKYTNMIDSLKQKMNQPTTFSGDLSAMNDKELDEWFNNLPSIKAQAEQAAESIRESFEQIEEPIQELTANTTQLANNMSQTFAEPEGEVSKFSESLGNVKEVVYGVQERLLELKGRMENTFVENGIKTYTKRYVELQNQITKTEKTLATLNANLARGRATNPKFESTTTYRKMQYDIEQATARLRELRAEQDKLETSGGATRWNFSSADVMKSMENGLKSLNATLSRIGGKITSFAKKILSIVSPARLAKKALGGLSNTSDNLTKSLFRTTKMLKLMVVRMALRAVIDGVKTGFQNLVQYSDRTNKSASMLMNSLNQLKNSFAAMVSPIFNAVAPALNSLIQMLIKVSNAINQTLSALVGRSTWTKAKELTDDYAESLKSASSAAKGTTRDFDELKVITTKNSSGSGTDASDMFEEEEIESKWKDMSDWLKGMWESADFTELGDTIGNKIKGALDGINWEGIKKSASNIGKSIATLINGFVEVEDLGTTIGNTLAQGINTAFEGLNSFVHNLHWDSVGKFIADTLNGFFENIDWEKIKDTFVTGFGGLADSINSFIANFHWDNISDSVAGFVNTLTSSLDEFFSTVEWGELGSKIGGQLQESIDKIDTDELGTALGTVVQGALDFLLGLIGELDMLDIAQKIIDTLKSFFDTVDIEDLAGVILGLIAAKLAIKAAGDVFDLAGQAIVKAIAKKITKHIVAEGVGSTVATSIGTEVATSAGTSTVLAGAGTALGVALLAAIVAYIGFNVGKEIGKALFPDDADWYDNFSWFGDDGFFSTVSSDWGTSFDALLQMADDFTGGLTKKEREASLGIIDWFAENVASLIGFVTTAKENITGFATTAKDKISGFVSDSKTKFENFKTNCGEKISSWASSAKENIETFKTNAGEKISSFKENAVSKLETFKTNAGAKILAFKNTATTNLETFKTNAVTKITTFKTNALNKFSEWYTSAKDYFKLSQWTSLGENVIKGLKQGLTDKLESLKETAQNVADTIKGAIKDVLNINSPSRVMRELGQFTMEGYQIGIEDLYSDIENSVKSFSAELTVAPQLSSSDSYGATFGQTTIPDSNSYIYYSSNNSYDASETNSLLRQQNELLQAILQKPTLDNDDIFNAARTVYKGKAVRKYGSSNTFDPVWG